MAAMHSDETVAGHSQTTSAFAYTAPASKIEETTTTYSDETAATPSPVTPATSVETAPTTEGDMKSDDMKDDDMNDHDMNAHDIKDDDSVSTLSDLSDSVSSLSSMSDTELEILSLVMQHAEECYTNTKPGKSSQPTALTQHH
jgi:hypothetical protein